MASYYKDKSLKPDERELNTIAAYKKLHRLESENAALKEIEELLTEDIKAKIVKNKKLLKEVKKLREVLKDLVEATEYGENQWQAAFSPDKETKGQKSIKKAKEVLKDD